MSQRSTAAAAAAEIPVPGTVDDLGAAEFFDRDTGPVDGAGLAADGAKPDDAKAAETKAADAKAADTKAAETKAADTQAADAKAADTTATETKADDAKTAEAAAATAVTELQAKIDVQTGEIAARDKQVLDGRSYGTQVAQQNAKLRERLEAAGEDVSEFGDLPDADHKDPRGEAPAAAARIDPDLRVRAEGSRVAANALHGKDLVDKLIFAEGAPFLKLEVDPSIAARVMGHSQPTLEALRVLDEHVLWDKYGGPKEVVQKIRAELEPAIRDEVRAELLAEQRTDPSRRFNGVGGVPRAGEEKRDGPTGPPAHTSLAAILNPELAG